jgi:hypothetical protein
MRLIIREQSQTLTCSGDPSMLWVFFMRYLIANVMTIQSSFVSWVRAMRNERGCDDAR